MSNVDFYQNLDDPDIGIGSIWDTNALFRNSFFANWCKTRSSQKVKILNVGCGSGYFSRDIAVHLNNTHQLKVDSYGCDIVQSTKTVFDEIPGDFKFKIQDCDGKRMQYDDQMFDIVICNHVIEHIFHTEQFIEELFRILRPGGTCILSTPNLSCWINRILLLFGIQPFSTEVGTRSMEYGWPIFRKKLEKWTPPGHIRAFTSKALIDMVTKLGFEVRTKWKQEKKLLYRNIALIMTRP